MPQNVPVNNPKTALLILAAGQASRMGEPKQLLEVNGQTLISRIVTQCLSTEHRPVVAVLGAYFEPVQKAVKGLPVEIVQNENWQDGLGSSISAGVTFVEKAHPQVEAIVILLCDQPLVDATFIETLIAAYANNKKPIVAAEYAGGLGVPALFARSRFPALQQLSADKGAKKIMQQHLDDVFSISFPEGQLDLDTPCDYQAFLNKTRL